MDWGHALLVGLGCAMGVAVYDLSRRAKELERDVTRLVEAIKKDRAERAPIERRLEVLEQWHRGDYDRS